jgi:hypothetical protein
MDWMIACQKCSLIFTRMEDLFLLFVIQLTLLQAKYRPGQVMA